MIDYDKSDPDPVVAEVRHAREEIMGRFNFDLDELFAETQRRQATSGRNYAILSPVVPSPRKISRKAG